MRAAAVVLMLLFTVGCGDNRRCLRSHEEQTQTWVLVGKVLVPIYGTQTVCDERASA